MLRHLIVFHEVVEWGTANANWVIDLNKSLFVLDQSPPRQS